jgi:hypothetical protein
LLFRSDLVRNRDPFFDESIAHANDGDACFDLLKSCDFGFVHQVLTFTRPRQGSLYEASKAIKSGAADMLRELALYGPFYLDKAEFDARLSEAVHYCYDILSASLTRRRDKELWEFHFSWLAVMGSAGRKVLRRLRLHGD